MGVKCMCEAGVPAEPGPGSRGSCGWRSCRQTTWTSSSAGTALSIFLRNFRNSWWRWRRCSWLMTVPSAMLKAANRLVIAVAGVVVGAALGHAGHHREHRLGPVEGLDLGLLVHAQHHGLLRRVVVEADDVDDLLDEQRVGGQLERVLDWWGLRLEFPPDPADGRLRQAGCASPSRPATSGWRPSGSLLQGRGDDFLDPVQQDGRRPAGAGLVVQAVQPALRRTGPATSPRSIPGDPQFRGDVLAVPAVRAAQHDPRAQRQRLRRRRPARPPGQLRPLGGRQVQPGLRPAPARSRSASPASPSSSNRARHFRTMLSAIPSPAAAPELPPDRRVGAGQHDPRPLAPPAPTPTPAAGRARHGPHRSARAARGEGQA